jgi:anti-sigma B factor antagonist
MSAAGYPFQMARGLPVITAPGEIDTTTAWQLRAVLFEWQTQGYTTVVVDLTHTQFCDSTGLRELVWAHKRAVADGGGLRLVIQAEGAVARIFTVTGLDGLLPRYTTLQQALALAPHTAARRSWPGIAADSSAVPVSTGDHRGLIVDGRSCERCGTVFVPRREHARFCSPGCRAAWNREHLGDPAVQASALTWSLAAMSEATALLPAVKTADLPEAFAAIEEAVWWITMVDATLLRHHPAVYDGVLAAHPRAGRQLIVETLAGLRFVRNWISRGTGLEEAIDTSEGWRIPGWTWKPTGEPALAWLPPRAQAWKRARHRAYQARLADHTIGTTFGRVVTFLALTGSDAACLIDTGGTPPATGVTGRAGDLRGTASPWAACLTSVIQ